MGDAALVRDDLLGAERQGSGELGGQRPGFVQGVGVQRLGSAQHRRQRLNGGAHDVVVGLLGGERAAGGLGVEAQLERAFLFGPEAVAHDVVPDAARGAVLGNLLEEIVVGVEEEGEPGDKLVQVQPALEAPLHVFDAVAQGEGQLLHGGGAGFADVVAADGDGVPARRVLDAELKGVNHQPHRRRGRVDVFLLRDVFLQDVVLDGAAQALQLDALFLRHRQVHGPDGRGGGVDGHGGGDVAQRDAVEHGLHVAQGADRHAALAHLALGEGVVAVVAHQGGQVEGNRKAGLALAEQVVQALVGVGRAAEAAELPHGPQPPAVHAGVDAAGVGRLAGEAQVALGVEVGQVSRSVEPADGMAADGGELLGALGLAFERLLERGVLPGLLGGAGFALPFLLLSGGRLAVFRHAVCSCASTCFHLNGRDASQASRWVGG